MKNIKKIGLVLLMALVVLGGCSNKGASKKIDLDAAKTAIDEKYFKEAAIGEVDAEYVENWYGLKAEDYVKAVGTYPMISAVSFEVVMFEAKDGGAAAIETAIQTRVDAIKEGFGYPSTMVAAENALIFTEGNYVFLVMTYESSETEDAQPTIDSNNAIKADILALFK